MLQSLVHAADALHINKHYLAVGFVGAKVITRHPAMQFCAFYCVSDAHTQRDKGLAIIETAICLPLFVGLLLCLVDLGLGLITYFRFVQVARDAVALGAHLDALAVGVVCRTETEYAADGRIIVSAGAGGCSDAKQLLIHDRANTLAALFPRWVAGMDQESMVVAPTGAVPWPTLNYVVTARYRPLLLSRLRDISLRVRAVGTISPTGAKLALSAADEATLRSAFNVGSCVPIAAGTSLSQGLLINLAGGVCVSTAS